MHSNDVCGPGSKAGSQGLTWSVQEGERFCSDSCSILVFPRAFFPVSFQALVEPSSPQGAPAASDCTVLFLGLEERLHTDSESVHLSQA